MNNLENIKGIVGYKVFKSDWTCRNNFKYEIGKTYKHKDEIGLCKGGFHFCRKLISCFNYYSFNPKNKVAIVIATGKVINGDDKSVTDEITIMKEISWHEVLNMVNDGNGNTGLGNTGNRNSGDYNSGNYNSGYYNSGYYNSGDRNTGDCNVGHYNSGNRNVGDFNTGNRNSGDFNTCNHSTGIFNTEEDKIKIFNKLSDWTYEDWLNSRTRSILCLYFRLVEWIDELNMSEEEKKQYPHYKTTKGYLKKYTYKEAWKNTWKELTEEEKEVIVTELPNFDKDIFKEITGIEVNED